MIKNKNNYNIAIIEDNQGDFILIKDYLEEQIESPLIHQIKNFKEAEQILKSKNFDVILLDLTLPDSGGQKLITDILKIAGDCPVIILTGYGDIEFSIKSLSLGVADYLLKDDINATSLYKSIIYCLERQRSLMQLQQSEIRYSNLFSSTPQPMWLYDPVTLGFVQVNKAAVEHYGYTEDEFLNSTIVNLRPEKDIAALRRVIKSKHGGENEKIYKGTFTHCKKSKELIKVEIYSSPVILNNKKYRLAIAIDVTEKILLEGKLLAQKIDEQKKITKAVISAQEEERSEIGIELHDNVNQLLAASKLYLIHCLNNPADYKDSILKTQEFISQAMEELRKLSHALVGPDKNKTVSLIDSLEKLVKDIAAVKKIKIHLNYCSNGKEEIEERLAEGLKLNIYRIVQEQLNNIIKHADASVAKIDLSKDENQLLINIHDNGKGFFPEASRNGIGLINIKNRAEMFNGKFDIISSPGNGCTVSIVFKIHNEVIAES
ncbi:MAG: response regulator [Bacteroidota bacterium]|nr:response regulator [Bacteroidota bacterium]